MFYNVYLVHKYLFCCQRILQLTRRLRRAAAVPRRSGRGGVGQHWRRWLRRSSPRRRPPSRCRCRSCCSPPCSHSGRLGRRCRPRPWHTRSAICCCESPSWCRAKIWPISKGPRCAAIPAEKLKKPKQLSTSNIHHGQHRWTHIR